MSIRLWAAGVLTCALISSADADVLRATLGQPLREVSHAVDVTVADGIATYRVRRVFANLGDVADEAGLEIDLPFGAAATGLRIRARDRWYDAELMEREKAAALYEKLTGKGAYAPKDPALLQWLWADKLYLQVFPVLPGATSTVEYTLTVPTRYQGGRVFLSYPRMSMPGDDGDGEPDPDGDPAGRPLAAPVITVTPGWGDATTRVVVDGLRTAPGAPIVLGAAVRPPWLEQVGATEDASYVASTIAIPATTASKKAFARAKVSLAIDHTYRSDLRVDLLTPKGARIVVHDGSGGGDNDLKGSFELKLPAGTTGAGAWQLVVSDHAARDVGTLDTWSIELGAGGGAVKAAATDLPLFVPDAPETANDAGVATIELAPPRIDVLAARLGKVVAADKKQFARLELDLAPELRPLPKQAQVVFVIDGSHSVGQAGIDLQLAIVRAYLAHVPDAAAEIVVYRRTAARLFGGFLPAKDVAAALAAAGKKGALAPGNGSALDDGVKVAAAALAGKKGPTGRRPRASARSRALTPFVGALRMVVTTDELLRGSFTTKLATAGLGRLPASAIVHVVRPDFDGDRDDDAGITLARDDAAALAPIATGRHGVFARLDHLAGKPDKEVVAGVLGLVRPIQIDRVKVAGLAISADDADLNGDDADALREGTGLHTMQLLPAAPDTVTITGMIWSDPYRKTVRVTPAFARATAGWVFSEDEHGELTDAEQLKVAMMGRAVSPVTSYLAVEPGVRPSTAGIDRRGMGIGRSGFGAGGGGLAGGAHSVRRKPDLMALVAPAARACIAKHKPAAGWKVSVEVETTEDEVVDAGLDAGAKLPVAACLLEAVWAVRLTSAFDLEREQFTLVFAPATAGSGQ